MPAEAGNERTKGGVARPPMESIWAGKTEPTVEPMRALVMATFSAVWEP